MRMRESRRSSPRFSDIAELLPVLSDGQSDSASFDNVLELLVLGGRPLAHAMAMLIPEAWEGDAPMSPDRRAFFEDHASLMKPWDRPAPIAFTHGPQIG